MVVWQEITFQIFSISLWRCSKTLTTMRMRNDHWEQLILLYSKVNVHKLLHIHYLNFSNLQVKFQCYCELLFPLLSFNELNFFNFFMFSIRSVCTLFLLAFLLFFFSLFSLSHVKRGSSFREYLSLTIRTTNLRVVPSWIIEYWYYIFYFIFILWFYLRYLCYLN